MTNPSEPEAVGTTETVLKPCPFCGELPLLINGTWLDTGGGDGARRWGVECLNDDCVVRPISVLLGPHGYRRDDDPPSNADAKAEAIAAWNTRAPSSAPEVSELVELLELGGDYAADVFNSFQDKTSVCALRVEANIARFDKACAALAKVKS